MDRRSDGWWWRTASVAMAAATVAVGAACGDDGAVDESLTPEEQAGRSLVIEYTCQACHGQNLVGGMAPTLAGLPGRTVTLADGTTQVADDAYLARSISDPQAQIAPGEGIMPSNDLSPDEIAQVIAYIKSLPAPGS